MHLPRLLTAHASSRCSLGGATLPSVFWWPQLTWQGTLSTVSSRWRGASSTAPSSESCWPSRGRTTRRRHSAPSLPSCQSPREPLAPLPLLLAFESLSPRPTHSKSASPPHSYALHFASLSRECFSHHLAATLSLAAPFSPPFLPVIPSHPLMFSSHPHTSLWTLPI